MEKETRSTAPEDIQDFMTSHNKQYIFMLRKDGSPTAIPMTQRFREGKLYFHTYRKSAKVPMLKRDSRVTSLVLANEDEDLGHGGLIFKSRAELLEGDEAVAAYERGVTRGIANPNAHYESIQQEYGVQEAIQSGSRVIFRIPAELKGHLEPWE